MTRHDRQARAGRTAARLGSLLLIWLLLPACAGRDYTYQAVRDEYPSSRAVTRPEAVPQPARPLAGPLTLTEAIQRALADNPDQDVALARINQSEAMVMAAMAPFLPMLTAYAEYSLGDAPSGYLFKTIDQRALPPNTNFNDPGSFTNWEVGARAGWNLFRGGRDLLGRRMAETGLSLSQLDRRSTINGLTAGVIMAFYNCLAAREFEIIARDSMALVEDQLRVMEVRYQGGAVLRSDILSLNVRLAQAREDLVRAGNNYRLSLAALANLMGADLDSEFEPVDPGEGGVKAPEEYAMGLARALRERPELAMARARVVNARMALDQARGGYLPSLDAKGRYYWDAENLSGIEADKANWTAALELSWDMFSGGATAADVARAQAALAEMLASDRKAVQSVQLDVKTAYLNRAEARARLDVTRAGVEQSAETLKLVKRQYEGGAATITRYLEAELDGRQARIRSTAARYDLLKARADLARALGLLAGDAEEGKAPAGAEKSEGKGE